MQFIYDIFRQIVIDTPPAMGCERINAFFVLFNATDWEGDSFGKTHDDYLNNHYWTRKQISKANLAGDYGVLAIERRQDTIEGDTLKDLCHNFILTIGQIPNCANCPDECNRTKIEIDESNMRVLTQVVAEFTTYGYYTNIKEPNQTPIAGWLSDGRAAYLRTQGYVVNQRCIDIGGNTTFDELGVQRYNLSDFKTSDNAQSMSVEMTVCNCDAGSIAFDYSIQGDPNNKVGVVGCDTCLSK